jgi:hypothetical protein
MSDSNSTNIVFKKSLLVLIIIVVRLQSYSQGQTLSQFDSSYQIDKLVLQEFNAINKFYNKQFKIYKTTGLTKASRRDFHIELNTQDIMNKSESVDSSFKIWVVVMVIAHEFSHLLQFEGYNENFETYNFKVLEAQADLLAGIYLARRTITRYQETHEEILIHGVKSQNRKTNDLIWGPSFQTAYDLFFDIGTNTFALSDHPNQDQRKASVIRGARFGELWLFYYAIDKSKIQHANQNQSRRVKDLDIEEFSRAVTLSEMLQWSYDQAKLIVHGNPENLVDVLNTASSLKNYKRKSISVFSLTLLNIGKDTLAFKFENRIEDFSLLNVYEYLDSNSSYHTVILYPNRPITIRDTFKLVRSTIDVISPPSNLSLFYCNRLGEIKRKANITRPDLNLEGFDGVLFLTYIDFLIDALERNDYSKIVANMGSGICHNDNCDLVDYDGIVLSDPKFRCTIVRSLSHSKRSTIDFDIGNFETYHEMDSVYNFCMHLLDSVYRQEANKNIEIHVNPNTLKQKSSLKEGNQSTFSVIDEERTKRYQTSNCSIMLISHGAIIKRRSSLTGVQETGKRKAYIISISLENKL